MNEYSKIQTLFERDPKTFVVDPTRLKSPVYGTIKEWDVTEKVDGMNIRVIYNPDSQVHPVSVANVRFAGRSDAAQLPGDLLQYLQKTFTPELFAPHFQTPVILYGEGYGAGIQKVGKSYRPDKSFIMFDVLVDGQWWLDTQAVQDLATTLKIDAVPYIGRWTLEEITRNVRVGWRSKLGDVDVEGIVARPTQTLFDSRHERVILKLKTKDFQPGKR